MYLYIIYIIKYMIVHMYTGNYFTKENWFSSHLTAQKFSNAWS